MKKLFAISSAVLGSGLFMLALTLMPTTEVKAVGEAKKGSLVVILCINPATGTAYSSGAKCDAGTETCAANACPPVPAP